MVDLKVFIECL